MQYSNKLYIKTYKPFNIYIYKNVFSPIFLFYKSIYATEVINNLKLKKELLPSLFKRKTSLSVKAWAVFLSLSVSKTKLSWPSRKWRLKAKMIFNKFCPISSSPSLMTSSNFSSRKCRNFLLIKSAKAKITKKHLLIYI